MGEMATRYIGNCQICEGDFKLADGRMVHHGYKRPGDGYIVGDCQGVADVPYEVSCELVRVYLGALVCRLAALRGSLVDYTSGAVVRIVEQRLAGFGGRDAKEIVYLKDGATIATSSYEFRQALDRAVRRIERNISLVEQDVARCEHRIAAWKLSPIRTLEEEVVKADALRAARVATAADRKAARDAEKVRKEEKRNELVARRQMVVDAFVARFREAAKMPDDEYRNHVISAILHDLGAKKHAFIRSLGDLKCDGFLTDLGLRSTVNGWPQYATISR